ncbi:MAG: hypothetical protein J7K77_01130 [Dehalococcoidales bacterium]|nr:hypothetical protein [Dehalococcoidales bacterium]
MKGRIKVAMARGGRFEKIEEVCKEGDDRWEICLQWGTFVYKDGRMEQAYRFIWKDDNEHLRAQKAQAFIKSLDVAQELINKAKNEGWGDNMGGYI